MKVCIIGGGNIGTLLLAELARRGGTSPVLYTHNIAKWSDSIDVFNHCDELLFSTSNFSVTSSLKDAVKNAEQIWITLPAFMQATIAAELFPLVYKQTILLIPGQGGGEFSFISHVTEKHCILGGMQRVHSISRVKEYGKSVCMLGRKKSVQIATIPAVCAEKIGKQVSNLLNMPCEVLPNYLTVTLTPSNPILHTARLYSMFKFSQADTCYERNFFFYEEWTDDASAVMLECDRELQRICQEFAELDLSAVKSLKVHYERDTVSGMTEKIRSIIAFKGILSPMVQTKSGKYVVDFSSRYFLSDFAFGLKVILDIAAAVKIDTPNLQKLWSWYKDLAGVSNYFSLSDDFDKNKLQQYYQL